MKGRLEQIIYLLKTIAFLLFLAYLTHIPNELSGVDAFYVAVVLVGFPLAMFYLK